MSWKSIRQKNPERNKKLWISYIVDGIFTEQRQTYAKVVGKDSNQELLWHDFMTKEIIDNSKMTVTHWMETPDNPIVLEESIY